MLLRLAYLGITNAFTLLRLLPGSDRDKDAEILALRHQLAVLHRQLDAQRIRLEPPDRVWVRAPPRRGAAARAAGPAANRPLGPRVGAAPGPGEPVVGLPASTRGIAHPRDQG